MPPIVSIVICTYNRAELLKEALDSLIAQTADRSLFEVIIVNNNSTDDTQLVAEQYSTIYSNIKVCIETKQGLSHARNLGYKMASSGWVAYLDDDARAFPNWVERILYVIKHYNFDCFGGIFLPWYKFGRPKWFQDGYGSNGYTLPTIGVLKNDTDFVFGGNFVIKKSVLERFNGFSTKIGMCGDKIAYGEEILLQVQMRKQKLSIGFDPELKIEHLVAIYKLTPFWYLKSGFALGRDYWSFRETPISMKQITKYLVDDMLNCVMALVYSLYKLLKHNYYPQNLIIDSAQPLFFLLGRIAGAVEKYRSHRNRK